MGRVWEFDQQDFVTLQNAMSQLATLASSAPTFLMAMTAAKNVLVGLAEAEDLRDKAIKMNESAVAYGVTLKAEIAALEKERVASLEGAKAARVSLGSVSAELAAATEESRKGLAQYRASEQERMDRELAIMEKEERRKISSLTEEVAHLEERKAAAEAALQAIKAKL